LLPLARFLWLGTSSKPPSAFAQRADLEPHVPSIFAGDGDKDNEGAGARRGRVYAVCVLLFPLALAWSDRLAKVQIVSWEPLLSAPSSAFYSPLQPLTSLLAPRQTNQLDLLAFGSYGAVSRPFPFRLGGRSARGHLGVKMNADERRYTAALCFSHHRGLVDLGFRVAGSCSCLWLGESPSPSFFLPPPN
jgi:hypothetical protein